MPLCFFSFYSFTFVLSFTFLLPFPFDSIPRACLTLSRLNCRWEFIVGRGGWSELSMFFATYSRLVPKWLFLGGSSNLSPSPGAVCGG
ncbi:uncharacterized protein B0T15DRAFT_525529 [Chaetomium strumarium]|uniref:Secreted protein n=1 Tax=Chaetomium strumarium TaxID=1170767 RepID=A0AAJ0M4M0_9PEZI|nr:hypothetical protein B0T15DRAFT_525529 [Chaetomium strumarium]